MSAKTVLKAIFRPLVYGLAAIYFTIDALFLVIARPVTKWLSRYAVLKIARRWITSRSPYAALALFAIPWLVLEPIKPAALYIMATGHFVWGVALLIAGELLKLVFVERLYDLNKEKLMSIPTFAWTFNFGKNVLDWLQITRLWRLVGRGREKIKMVMRKTLLRWRRYFAAHERRAVSSKSRPRGMRPARSLSAK